MKERTIKEFLSDLEYWKGLLEYEYRREHKIAPSWLYEKIHHLEKQIKEKQNERRIHL
ncbi:MAG: hypothetical protein IJF87_08590 [Erysipelotrichaceae bacterium]|nr:hypothetical protein [Erysipelotrichaceae bacterium]